MKPTYVMTDDERRSLHTALTGVTANPYQDYPSFSRAVAELVERHETPAFLSDECERIRADRESGASDAHVLRNCPIDTVVPLLDHDDPLADKYARRTTFVGEVFLELFARLVGTPLLAYATRFNGDFFIDVIAHNRYRGQQTGFSDGELVYHNDRTAHRVRADFITLLGMRCPEQDVVYTCFVGGRDLLAHLTDAEQEVLRWPYFSTPFDVVSKDNNTTLTRSDAHPILQNDHSFRYLDTHTTVAPDSPKEAKDALIALKNALARAEKTRHRIQAGDLFTFANQDGLHSRERLEVADPGVASARWLMKTYAFRDRTAADRFADGWVNGIAGLVAD
jgi:L-asparagine oxygenase